VVTGEPVVAWGGWTESKWIDPAMGDFGSDYPVEHNLRAVKNMVAGYVAEMVLGPDPFREGSSLDERVGATLLSGQVAVWAGMSDHPLAILRRAEEEIAAALLAKKEQCPTIADVLLAAQPDKIDGSEIARILTA
jgi:hypothetical protein